MVVTSAALLLVAAVGAVAVYGAIAPQRQPPPGAALAVIAPHDTAAHDAAHNAAASNDDADIRFAVAIATASEPATRDPATPYPTAPEPATTRPGTSALESPGPLVADSSTRRGGMIATDDGDTADTGVPSVTRPADGAGRRGAIVTQSGWVCDGTVRLEDPRGRRWSLGGATFRAGPGYERVVLHIDRLGPGNGAAASMTAQALSSGKVRGTIPGVRTPSSGQTTFSLHLAGPIEGNLGVRGYQPNGLRLLKRFSVYPAAGGSSRVLVSAASGECFRARVPAWTATGPNTSTAQIYLDIKS
jgi:hypothetical protein